LTISYILIIFTYMEKLKIRKALFWDVDTDRFNEVTNRKLIIERVFCYGTVDELVRLLSFYGIETIRKEIRQAGSMDKKTLEFASTFLNIPKQHFRCYK
jgi:hypothetical protein